MGRKEAQFSKRACPPTLTSHVTKDKKEPPEGGWDKNRTEACVRPQGGGFTQSANSVSEWPWNRAAFCPLLFLFLNESVHWSHPVIVSLWIFECECMGKCVYFSSYICRSRRALSILDEDTTKHCLGVHCLGMAGPGQ